MMADLRELLPLYALGILEADEADRVERAVAADPALAHELASYRDAAPDLIVPIEPPPEVKARLLASVGAGRFDQFADRLARLFDVATDRARELLGLIERPASWEPQIPGIALVHFASGPAYAAADCGYVRLDPGAVFPLHTHRGEEVSLILAGQLRDSTGRILSPGDELVQAEGTAHDLTCIGETPCIFAARAMNGIEIGGSPVRTKR